MFTEKFSKIKEYLSSVNADAYILSKFDPHNSEYGSEKINPIRFLTGFTGSTATCVVFKDAVHLWVDGRYYIQADQQTEGTGIVVQKLAQPGVLPYLEYIIKNLNEGAKIVFDGTTVPFGAIQKLDDCGKNFVFDANSEFIYSIWDNRPELLDNKIYEHDQKFTGKTVNEKVADVRAKMAEDKVNFTIISQLEDIAWVTNLRGQDVAESPTFMSYCIIGTEEVALFLNKSKIDFDIEKISKYITLFEYEEIFDYIDNKINTKKDNIVSINPNVEYYKIYTSIKTEIKDLSVDYTNKLKALKNPTELQGMRNANIRDNAALVTLVKWIKENQQAGFTEYEIDEKVIECRLKGENYVLPSFAPIVAFNENGAQMHYRAIKENCAVVKGDGLLLIDSGASYIDGTTDITRTFAIGTPTDEMIADYTRTLRAMLNLSTAYFLAGTEGKQLDIFARSIMWRNKQDYKYGTGHGVGHFLSVHEGPQGVSPRGTYPFEPGMIVTNEPGVYKTGKYGIRLENTIVCEEVETNPDGTFYGFETISWFPFDLDCIDKNQMEKWEIEWLNNYHKTTYEKLENLLDEEHKYWLKNATRAI